MTAAHDLTTTRVPVDELQLYHRNPRRGDVRRIAESLRVNGQYRPVVVNRGSHTGRPDEVLAGNHTVQGARRLGWSDVAVVHVDVDDDAAARIVAADNRTADVGGYDDRLLVELLADLPDLDGTGYDPGDLAELEAALLQSDQDDERARERGEGAVTPPTRRTLPLDVIFSWSQPAHPMALIAAEMGWQLGVITTAAANARTLYQRWPRAPRIAFMDNEWHEYDHAVHVAGVAEFAPKYATVRDLVTPAQADAEGVEHYSIERTLDMAAEVAEHTDNVILIPKYDCLDELPEHVGDARVVLGYSVESSYGGTPLPIEAFRGRPIHLLGGSWKSQRAYLNLMRDDVVSIDQNHMCNTAQWANVVMPDGGSRDLADLIDHPVHRAYYAAAVLSLATITSTIIEDYGVELAQHEPVADDPTTTGVQR